MEPFFFFLSHPYKQRSLVWGDGCSCNWAGEVRTWESWDVDWGKQALSWVLWWGSWAGWTCTDEVHENTETFTHPPGWRVEEEEVQFSQRVLRAAAVTSAEFPSGRASARARPCAPHRQWARLCGVSVWRSGGRRWGESVPGEEGNEEMLYALLNELIQQPDKPNNPAFLVHSWGLMRFPGSCRWHLVHVQ